MKHEDQGRPTAQSSKSKRQPNTNANETTAEPEPETGEEPDTGFFQFKWITYLLLFAIINLKTLYERLSRCVHKETRKNQLRRFSWQRNVKENHKKWKKR